MTKWTVKKIKPLPGALEQISKQFGVSRLTAFIILCRGLNNADLIEYYKNANIENLHSLADIGAVRTAFDIILGAVDRGDKIVVYGDYDVDGVTSTVILCKGLKKLGADVDYFIPDRHTDGYGLNPSAIKDISEKGCNLLITCDNGIAAKAEIDYAKKLGMAVVVLDHHEPPYTEVNGKRELVIPAADAVVDMKLESIDYPFRELCAGGLCYKFVRELFKRADKMLDIDAELAVFAALATVCDVVPLVDENRIIARYGLEIINKQVDNEGLDALIRINDLANKRITEYTFGFVIGPCINAGGRLEVAALAAELFTSEDEGKIEELAERLFELNSVRKEMTRESYEKLSAVADEMTDKVLVMYDSEVDESIAGIVAGRLKERYNKPAIVLTEANGLAKGSARSVECYNMFEALSEYRELFTKFGGHKMAAGMSLPIENIEALREGLNRSCTLTEDDMERVLNADKIITLDEVNIYSAGEMELFKPYGCENSEPMLALLKLDIKSVRFVGAEKRIAQLLLADGTGNSISAVWFDGDELVRLINEHYGTAVIDDDRNIKASLNGFKVDVMANLRLDEYNGNVKPKLNVRDMRVSKV
jgi:single-stranded-DNA-specific exonuclease